MEKLRYRLAELVNYQRVGLVEVWFDCCPPLHDVPRQKVLVCRGNYFRKFLRLGIYVLCSEIVEDEMDLVFGGFIRLLVTKDNFITACRKRRTEKEFRSNVAEHTLCREESDCRCLTRISTVDTEGATGAIVAL